MVGDCRTHNYAPFDSNKFFHLVSVSRAFEADKEPRAGAELTVATIVAHWISLD